MFYNENMPLTAATQRLIERRVKFTESQDKELINLSQRVNVPYAALIRMAVDAFIPRTGNCGFTDKGIKAGYLSKY